MWLFDTGDGVRGSVVKFGHPSNSPCQEARPPCPRGSGWRMDDGGTQEEVREENWEGTVAARKRAVDGEIHIEHSKTFIRADYNHQWTFYLYQRFPQPVVAITVSDDPHVGSPREWMLGIFCCFLQKVDMYYWTSWRADALWRIGS